MTIAVIVRRVGKSLEPGARAALALRPYSAEICGLLAVDVCTRYKKYSNYIAY